jgi:hypothetical protein
VVGAGDDARCGTDGNYWGDIVQIVLSA